MRLVPSLIVTGSLVVSAAAAVAQQSPDTVFKNVEYLSGSAQLSDKEKGDLVVSKTAVLLMEKKKPLLTIPIALIAKVNDTVFARPEKKKSSFQGGGIPSIGFLKKAKPDGQITIVTKKDSVSDSTVAESIVFQTTEAGGIQRITAAIRSRLAGGVPEQASAQDGAAAAAANEPLPLMVVANPYTAVEADSAPAVEIGTVIRDDIATFLGDKVQVLTRKQMNAALEPYGYPPDAMLNQSLATTLAKEIHASFLIVGELKKEADGKYTVTASIGSADDPKPSPVTVTQNAGESLTDFGHRVAEALKGPQKSTP